MICIDTLLTEQTTFLLTILHPHSSCVFYIDEQIYLALVVSRYFWEAVSDI